MLCETSYMAPKIHAPHIPPFFSLKRGGRGGSRVHTEPRCSPFFSSPRIPIASSNRPRNSMAESFNIFVTLCYEIDGCVCWLLEHVRSNFGEFPFTLQGCFNLSSPKFPARGRRHYHAGFDFDAQRTLQKKCNNPIPPFSSTQGGGILFLLRQLIFPRRIP